MIRIITTALALCVLVGYSRHVEAQTARNAVYVELGGNALSSLNYERALVQPVRGRLGVGYFELFGDASLLFPILANGLFGRGAHKLEVGLGVLVESSPAEPLIPSSVAATGMLGFRYQQEAGGVLFRAGLAPYWGAGECGVIPGLSLGYGF